MLLGMDEEEKLGALFHLAAVEGFLRRNSDGRPGWKVAGRLVGQLVELTGAAQIQAEPQRSEEA